MTFPELIRSQEELLRRLLSVSQQQLEILDRGDPTILVQFLEQRGRLWVEFELLEKQLDPHKGIPPERRVWKSPEERQQTESAVNRCKELLHELLANHQESVIRGEELKDKVEKNLRRVQLAKNAAPAYAKQSQIQQ